MDPAQAALAEFYDCAKKYAEKYSRSREPAQDIADASLSYCESPRERARTLLIDKLSVGGRSARDQVNSLFPGILEKARLLSIRTVVESRYEATLRAASAPASAPLAPAAPIVPAPLPETPPPSAPSAGPSPVPSVATPAPAPSMDAAPKPQPVPPPVSFAAPTAKPDEAVVMPYVDSTLPAPGSGGAAARPDPGAMPPEMIR